MKIVCFIKLVVYFIMPLLKSVSPTYSMKRFLYKFSRGVVNSTPSPPPFKNFLITVDRTMKLGTITLQISLFQDLIPYFFMRYESADISIFLKKQKSKPLIKFPYKISQM